MAQTLAFEALPEAEQQVLDNLAAKAAGPTDTAPGVAGGPSDPSTEMAPRQAEARANRRRELASTIAFGAEDIQQAKQFAVEAAAREAEAAQAAAQAAAGPESTGVPPSSEGGVRTLAFEVPAHVIEQTGSELPPSSEGGARTLAFEVPPHVHEQAPTTPPLGAVQAAMPEPDSTRTMAFGTDALPPQGTAAVPDPRPDAPAPQRRKRSSNNQTMAFSSEDVRKDRALSQTVAFGLDALEADVARPSQPSHELQGPSTQRAGEAPGPATTGPRQAAAGKPDLSSTIAFGPDEGGQFEPAPAKKKTDLASTMAFDTESVGIGEQIVDESSHIEVPSARSARTRTMLGGMSAPVSTAQPPTQPQAQSPTQSPTQSPATGEPSTKAPAQAAMTLMGVGQPAEVAAQAQAQASQVAAAAQGPAVGAPMAPQPGLPGNTGMTAPQHQGYTTAPPPAPSTGGTKVLVAVVVGSIIVGVAVALGLRFAGVF